MKMMAESIKKMTSKMLQEMMLWEMMWRFSEHISHIDALDDIVNINVLKKGYYYHYYY